MSGFFLLKSAFSNSYLSNKNLKLPIFYKKRPKMSKKEYFFFKKAKKVEKIYFKVTPYLLINTSNYKYKNLSKVKSVITPFIILDTML